jgi:hypothetical protein
MLAAVFVRVYQHKGGPAVLQQSADVIAHAAAVGDDDGAAEIAWRYTIAVYRPATPGQRIYELAGVAFECAAKSRALHARELQAVHPHRHLAACIEYANIDDDAAPAGAGIRPHFRLYPVLGADSLKHIDRLDTGRQIRGVIAERAQRRRNGLERSVQRDWVNEIPGLVFYELAGHFHASHYATAIGQQLLDALEGRTVMQAARVKSLVISVAIDDGGQLRPQCRKIRGLVHVRRVDIEYAFRVELP